MARSRIGRKPMSEINMVPFIDIMMVLLVAFMVSAPMLTQGVKVDLPKTSSKPLPLPEDAEAVIVSIKADGQYFVDLGSTREEAQNLDAIQEMVSKNCLCQPADTGADQGGSQCQLRFSGGAHGRASGGRRQ